MSTDAPQMADSQSGAQVLSASEKEPAEGRPGIRFRSLAPPEELFVMITSGCNLRCRHCWPQAEPGPAPASITLPQFRLLVDHFISLGLSRLCLTGGEPPTHPDLEEMVASAVSKTAIKQVCIQTNGVALTRERIARLWDRGREKIRFQVSLEGAGPQTHDAIRGSGSFDLALAGLRRLQDFGLGPRVTIAFTETASTITDLSDLLILAERLGVDRLVSGCLVSGGRALVYPDLRRPRPEQYRALLALYQGDRVFRDRYDQRGNFAAIEWYKGKSYPRDDSCRCMRTPYVTAEGDLYPCIMLPWPQWRVPDVTGRPFEAVLAEIGTLWPGISCAFGPGRPVPEACRSCPGQTHCGGGCLGRVTGAPDRLDGVEDRCDLRKTVYSWNGKQ